MPPETPAENPAFAEQLKAVQEALTRESANAFARTSLDGFSQAISGGKDAITAQLKVIQESPEYQSLSAATRGHLDALHTTVGAVVGQVTGIPAQVAGAISEGFNALPWYVKIPVIYGGIRLVESGARKVWKWITDVASSAKKMALIGGAGILAGIGIKSVYDGAKEGKPKTV